MYHYLPISALLSNTIHFVEGDKRISRQKYCSTDNIVCIGVKREVIHD